MSHQVAGMRKVVAILKAGGISVTEVSGWTTRRRSTLEPRRSSATGRLPAARTRYKGRKPLWPSRRSACSGRQGDILTIIEVTVVWTS
jgi:hypothetical protein